jgi:hypothetical protein
MGEPKGPGMSGHARYWRDVWLRGWRDGIEAWQEHAMAELVTSAAAALIAWARHESALFSALTFCGSMLALFGVCGLVSLALAPGRLAAEFAATADAIRDSLIKIAVSRETLVPLAVHRHEGAKLLRAMPALEASSEEIDRWRISVGEWTHREFVLVGQICGLAAATRSVRLPAEPPSYEGWRKFLLDHIYELDVILRDMEQKS